MSNQPIQQPRREWRNVRFTDDYICEMSGHGFVVSVPREIVQRIVLRHGLMGQRPLLEALVGGALACAAVIIPIWHFLWAKQGRWLLLLSPVFFLVVAIYGLHRVYNALRRGYFLEICYERGSKKVRFRRLPRIEDVEDFLRRVEETYGYQIERGIPTTNSPVG